ncbi:unnamed protein product, partial [Urochloa humidicola]
VVDCPNRRYLTRHDRLIIAHPSLLWSYEVLPEDGNYKDSGFTEVSLISTFDSCC